MSHTNSHIQSLTLCRLYTHITPYYYPHYTMADIVPGYKPIAPVKFSGSVISTEYVEPSVHVQLV